MRTLRNRRCEKQTLTPCFHCICSAFFANNAQVERNFLHVTLGDLCQAPAPSVSGPRRSPGGLYISPGSLCVGARHSVSDPAALCVGALSLSVSGPGALPPLSVFGPGALCQARALFVSGRVGARRSLALFVEICVAALGVGPRRSLCRAPELSVSDARGGLEGRGLEDGGGGWKGWRVEWRVKRVRGRSVEGGVGVLGPMLCVGVSGCLCQRRGRSSLCRAPALSVAAPLLSLPCCLY